jgi:MoxR-like ATPase
MGVEMSTTNAQFAALPDASRVAAAAANVHAVEAALINHLLERDEEIRCIVVGLVARKHVFFIGVPGTAKSMMADSLRQVLGGVPYFSLLMTRFTKYSEVFGPPSIPALSREENYFITNGFLPTATVAFLDEIFKSNSAIINSLLTGLNEGYFDNGTKGRVKMPLEMCIAASNELPEQNAGLEAMFDRFVIRRKVDPVADEDNFRALLRIKEHHARNPLTAQFDPADLAELRGAMRHVNIDNIEDSMVDLWKKLPKEHGISPTDRMWVNAIDLIKACAVLDGRLHAEGEDMVILAESMWNKPEDRDAVFSTVTSIGAPDLARAHDLVNAAVELFRKVDLNARSQEAFGMLAATNRELKDNLDEFDKLAKTSAIRKLRDKVVQMQQRCGSAAAGLL